MLNKKIVICSTIRDVEKDLESFFYKIDEITNKFSEYFIILVQSNSSDRTVEKSENLLKSRNGIIISKDLDLSLYRTQRLEICRNAYLDYIRNDKDISKYDYLIVMDADGVNNLITYDCIRDSINQKDDWSGLFANQKYIYYDIWTLRKKNYIDFDCFEMIKKEAKSKNKILIKIFYDYFTKFFYLNKHFKERFIQVESAFGGLGIYKLDKILNCKYDSRGGAWCEHVGVNTDLNKKYGGLFIDKKLINSSGISKHSLNGILCSKFSFFAKRFLKIINITVK